MSGRIKDAIVDFAAFSLAFDRVHCALVRSFLVRNWCGKLGGSEGPTQFVLDFLRHGVASPATASSTWQSKKVAPVGCSAMERPVRMSETIGLSALACGFTPTSTAT